MSQDWKLDRSSFETGCGPVRRVRILPDGQTETVEIVQPEPMLKCSSCQGMKVRKADALVLADWGQGNRIICQECLAVKKRKRV